MQCVVVGEVVAVAMGNRDFEDLPFHASGCKQRVGVLHLQMDIFTNEFQRLISEEDTGKESRFDENLKSIAYPEHRPAVVRKTNHVFHDRREPGEGSAPEIFTVRETGRKNYELAIPDRR